MKVLTLIGNETGASQKDLNELQEGHDGLEKLQPVWYHSTLLHPLKDYTKQKRKGGVLPSKFQ